METPKEMSLAETVAQISRFFERNSKMDEPGRLTCARCGGEIRRVRAFMSLHDEQFGSACIGPGQAWRMDIPYCADCEDPPSRYGCIHLSGEDLKLPAVREASRPFGADTLRDFGIEERTNLEEMQ